MNRPPFLHPFLVETDEGVVGYAIWTEGGVRGWVTAGLLPEARGQGIGVEVFRRLTAMVEHAGKVASLEVRETNQRAIAVYKKLGYTKVGTDGVIMRMERRRAS